MNGFTCTVKFLDGSEWCRTVLKENLLQAIYFTTEFVDSFNDDGFIDSVIVRECKKSFVKRNLQANGKAWRLFAEGFKTAASIKKG